MNFRHGWAVALAAIVTLTTVGAVLAAPTGASPSPSPWLQTNYNAANSRVNPAEGTITAANVAKLRGSYTLTAPEPTDCRVCTYGFSVPVISQGRLYALASDDLIAVDLATGRRLWTTHLYPDYNYLDLAVTHGYVVVGSTQIANDPDDSVDLYRSDTGAYVRSLSGPDGDGLQGVEVFGKYIVTHFGCQVECDGFLGRTIVYRTSNLSVAWTTPSARAATNVDVGTSVVDGQTFEVAQTSTGVQLRSYLAYNGAPKWRKNGYFTVLAGDTDAATAKNLIAVGADGVVVDLDPRTGTTRFTLPRFASDARSSANGPGVAVDATRIYAPCAADGTQFCAFSTADGHVLWQHAVPAGGSGYSVSVANGLVYLETGQVLSASSGAAITTLSGRHPLLVGSGRVGAYTNDTNHFTVLAPPAS